MTLVELRQAADVLRLYENYSRILERYREREGSGELAMWEEGVLERRVEGLRGDLEKLGVDCREVVVDSGGNGEG